jgi:hypothetical protein
MTITMIHHVGVFLKLFGGDTGNRQRKNQGGN